MQALDIVSGGVLIALSPNGLPAFAWWLLAAWVAALGGCFGSFMNVVIYRLPAGLSVVHPASRCPKCLHPIRGYDNIPVISWIVLRGRCRDCHNPVSARYPSIEALVAFVTLGVAMSVAFADRGELSLALRGHLIAYPWLLWGIAGGHVLLLCTLICATMIQYDGHPVPRRLFTWIAAFGLAAALFLPSLLGWGLKPAKADLASALWSVAALMANAVAGALIAWITGEARRRANGLSTLAASQAMIGLILGLAPGLMMASAATLLALVVRLVARRRPSLERIPVLASVTLIVFAWIVGWRWLVPLTPLLALAVGVVPEPRWREVL